MRAVQTLGRWLIAVFFVLAGANHFRTPEVYIAMIPPWIPAPAAMNLLSGTAEILGGIGLLLKPTRQLAGLGLIALLLLIFPANIYVAMRGHMDGFGIPPWALWARLPFQLVFIGWVWWTSQPSAESPAHAAQARR